jgi:hypothetical protein
MRISSVLLLLSAFVLVGCDINKVDPGGGYATATNVTVTSSLTGDQGGDSGPVGPNVEGNGNNTSAGAGPGELAGLIKFDGPAPARATKVSMGNASKDPAVCAKDVAILDESLVVGDDGGLMNVFIYMKKKPASWKKKKWAPETAPIFDQKNCVFLSHSFLLPAGVDIVAKNSDSVAHNANFAGLTRNTPFNAAIAGTSESIVTVPLVEATPARVNCDLHSWMDAYVLVIDHPFAATTNDKGEFSIKDIPSGTYDFRIWHERAKKAPSFISTESKIVIKAGQTTRLDLKFAPSEFK